jgi:hypothetical protein
MDLEQLVGEAREREPQRMPARERLVAGTTALAFTIVAGAVATLIPVNRTTDLPLLCALVVLAAIARRVRFEFGSGEACMDQLAFIPILFLAPLPIVPLLVAFVYIVSRLPEFARRQVHPDRWLYLLGDAWHSIGAVVVIAALAPGPLAGRHIGV